MGISAGEGRVQRYLIKKLDAGYTPSKSSGIQRVGGSVTVPQRASSSRQETRARGGDLSRSWQVVSPFLSLNRSKYVVRNPVRRGLRADARGLLESLVEEAHAFPVSQTFSLFLSR